MQYWEKVEFISGVQILSAKIKRWEVYSVSFDSDPIYHAFYSWAGLYARVGPKKRYGKACMLALVS